MATVRHDERGPAANSTRMTTREKLMLVNMIVWAVVIGLLAFSAL
jgi:hypothetical protein